MVTHTLTVEYTEINGISGLEEKDRLLLQKAWEACDSAYAPYSGFFVGASLRLENGLTVTGNNQENSAYPSGLCAERVALFSASSQYPGVAFESLAVVAKTEIFMLDNPATPCGGCRQVIAEYEMLSGKPIRIILQGNSEKIWIVDGIANLLPLMFHGGDLKK